MIDVLLIEADQEVANLILAALSKTGLKVKHCKNRFSAMGEIWVMTKLRRMPQLIIASLWLVDQDSETFRVGESVNSVEELATCLPVLKNVEKLSFTSKVLLLADNVPEARLIVKGKFNFDLEIKNKDQVAASVLSAVRDSMSGMQTRFTQLSVEEVKELAKASA